MDDRAEADRLEPSPDVEDAFSLLADQTRLSILREGGASVRGLADYWLIHPRLRGMGPVNGVETIWL